MAPELILGAKQYSTTIDMWSLGCIISELLSKEPLFNGKTEFEQLDKIFRILGTPNETIWPGFSKLAGAKVNFAKHQGQKRACVTYCITYILSCITKHSLQYKVLMIGRVLGGIATSLLFSAFESWLMAEHFKRGFDQQWLSLTFSKAIFLGNGLIAILSGLFGNLLVDSLNLGSVSPFDAAAIFLAIGMAIILSSWTENYGDPSEIKDLLAQFKVAAVTIA